MTKYRIVAMENTHLLNNVRILGQSMRNVLGYLIDVFNVWALLSLS